MSGTKAGGKLAAATNKAIHGADFYKRIGAIGGSRSRTGGFYANRELASIAGTIGGGISRRGRKVTEKERREIRKAYAELLAVHNKAKRERGAVYA